MLSTMTKRREPRGEERFRHDALFYRGPADFVERASAFIEDSLAADEQILVVVGAEKIELLRSALDGAAGRVRFADMVEVGRNPARIIPAWRAFAAEQRASGRAFRGLGEPIWATRSADELVECERHEALLNLAFAEAPPWWLACPYDTETLAPSVIGEARRNHPFVVDGGARRPSESYRGLAGVSDPFDRPLPEPAVAPLEFSFGTQEGLGMIRKLISGAAAASGLGTERIDDLVLAVNEVATNSLRHGGGRGLLRLWRDRPALICEVRDAGRIDDPLVGRGQPPTDRESGFGLWLANQLCDLVQIRTFADGNVVRLHVRL